MSKHKITAIACFVAGTFFAKELLAQQPKYTLEKKEERSSIAGQFYKSDKALDLAVDSVYNLLNNKQRAAQMIMTASSTAPNLGYPFGKARNMVQSDVAANVVFLKGTAAAFTSEVKQLNDLKKDAVLPPLYACDCEPSLINSKWADVNGVLPANQQKSEASVNENTAKINRIIQRVGVQLNFAPVVDLSDNKAVISNRAFGADAETIANLSRVFVASSQRAGIGATLKHFPGHGAVKGDSHKQSVYIDGPLTELNTFRSIIQSAEPPVAVMVGHIVVKNNKQYDTHGLPATLSPVIVTQLLRNELGFKGIITTDALNMLAAAKVPDADWKAAVAGVDLVLMPKDAATLNAKIATALEADDALAKQLKESVKRIIRYKLLMNRS